MCILFKLRCEVHGAGKRAEKIDALRKDATFAGEAKPRLKAIRCVLALAFWLFHGIAATTYTALLHSYR